jgi:anaerobic magnesium-protoporphyrin IX monomethyl ester cyclase
MKKTLLMYVTPPGQDDDYIAMPLGIIYLGAIVREAGLPVECLDERVSTEEEVKAAIERNDIIGLSALTPHVGRAVRWGEYAKKLGKRVMMGGPHATVDAHTFLDSGWFDVVVRGEAEDAIVPVIQHFDDKAALKEILGLSFFDAKGEKVVTPDRPLIPGNKLDSIPFPAWDMLPFDRYTALNRERLFYIFTSRGCPFRCIYCQKELTGRGFRTRSVENIVDELEHIVKDYQPGNVLFIDELFTCQKKRVYAICDEIIKRGLKLNWACETRVDMLDYDMAVKMRLAGCRRLYFGVETGSQRSLDTLKKDCKAYKIVEAIRTVRRAGIWSKVFLIVGTPNETIEDIRETERVMRLAMPDLIRASLFNPLTATESFSMYKDRIDPKLVFTEYVDSERSPYIHENFDNDSLNRIRRQMVSDYERWYNSAPQRAKRWASRFQYYIENPDEGSARLKRALGLAKKPEKGELVGAGKMDI